MKRVYSLIERSREEAGYMRWSEQQIQAWGRTENAALEGKRYYQEGKVKEISVSTYGKEGMLIQSLVEGNYQIPYRQKFVLKRNSVNNAYCECPYMRKYSGCCRHVIAAGYRFLEEQDFWIEELESQTDVEAIEVIQQYRRLTMEQVMTEHVEGHISLEATLQAGLNFVLTFRVGEEKKYVIKDIHKFVSDVEHRETVSYGKSLSFNHNIGSFIKESRPLVSFLIACVSDFEEQYGGYYGEYVKKELNVSKYTLDKFMELFINQKIIFINDYGDKKTVLVKRENPQLCLEIKKKNKKSYEFTMEPFDYFRGASYLYIVVKGILFQCDEKYTREMEPFLEEMAFKDDFTIKVNERDMQSICAEVLPKIENNITVQMEEFSMEDFLPPEAKATFYLDMPNSERITCKTEINYGDKNYNLFENLDNKGLYRDFGKEFQLKEGIKQFFPHWSEAEQYCYQENQEDKAYELAVQGIPLLEQMGKVMATDKLKKLSIRRSPRVSLGVSVKSNLLEITMDLAEYDSKDLENMLSAYRKKKKYYRLKSGEFVPLEENSFSMLSELVDSLQISGKEIRKGNLTIPLYRSLYLDRMFKENEHITINRDHYFKEIVRNVKAVEDSDYHVPISLKKILRSYQKTGYRWLRTLADYGFGGILADDMGLGKTLQMITFLLSIEEEQKKEEKGPLALIVCPASLVYNWENELERFAPQLSKMVITGDRITRRAKMEEGSQAKIWITSFDLLRRDIEEYDGKVFYCHIIDEAQFIKNHNTQIAKASKKIISKMRFALTGTPMENKLSELWSIFDFLMPDYLYSYSKFKKEFEYPIVQNKDEKSMKRLHKMIAPFLLRRVKKEVLKELPDKVEQIVYTKLEGEQRKIYAANANKLANHLKRQTLEQYKENKIEILAELTKLRQICCAPQLCYEDYSGEQAKIETALELVRNAVDGGHKVLIFSQFKQLLEIVEERLKKSGYSYYKLTGSTKKEKRIEYVQEFNSNQIPVFLISLKAGGTGLNLTAADIVIHLDPWWNVAAQNQATDRAHRIGQKSTVTVFNLIAKDTIEEKIIKMQEVKKDLTEQVLEKGELIAEFLTKDQILDILNME